MGNFVKKNGNIKLVKSSILIILLHLHVVDFGIVNEIAIQTLATISGLSMSLFYITTVLFLLQKETWRKLLHPLRYVGRMALTNYIMQTLVGITVFKGLGLFGEINLGLTVLVSLILFPAQILFSYLWLKKYRYGPLEWLWRTATYGRFQPIKHRLTSRGCKNNDITIRQEQGKDYTLQCAFADAEYSDKKEHPLVARMRKSVAFIPKLSLSGD